MSTILADNITDRPGTGGPTLPNGLTIGTAPMPAVTGDAPIYACRAWVNFNGTGTVAIRASGNVSSITDNNPGDYTVNFTTAMADVNYISVVNPTGTSAEGNGYIPTENTGRTTSAYRFQTTVNNGASATSMAFDKTIINVAIFR